MNDDHTAPLDATPPPEGLRALSQRLLLDALAEGVVVCAADGSVTAANTTARRLLGVREGEPVWGGAGDRSWRVIHEDGTPFTPAEHPVLRTVETGRAQTGVVMGLVEHEEQFLSWVSMNTEPIFTEGESGKPALVVVSLVDITMSKMASEALLKSERRYRTLLDAIPDVLMVLERDGMIVEAHNQSHDILTALVGANMLDALADETLQTRFAVALASVQEGAGVLQLEFEQGGRYFEARLAALNASEVFLIVRDITVRQRAQLALAERAELLTSLRRVDDELTDRLDVLYVLAVGLDAALRLSGANIGYIVALENETPVLAQHIGLYPNDMMALLDGAARHLLGTRVTSFTTTDRELLQPKMSERLILPLIAQDRLVGLLNLEARQQGKLSGEPVRFITLITARIAIALDNARLYQVTQAHLEALRQAHQQVSELERLKTQMIRVAAHDIRSPLGVISGYIELLEDDLGEDRAQYERYLAPIRRAIRRMERMTTDVLSLERIHAASTGERKPVSMRDLVERAHTDARDSAAARMQTISLTIPSGKGRDETLVEGDAVQLYEAVSNLIGNALKYTSSGGTVRVRLWREGERVVFEVEDNGIGIPDEYHTTLFEPFFRVKTEETKAIDGTGLGLYLVKSLIERHGGRVYFSSRHGHGSTFGFELRATTPL